jgi:hypothetical protein
MVKMTVRFRVLMLAAFVSAFVVAGAGRVAAADPVLYRIFLNDGAALVSYGEYARVADRVVFSMPIGATAPSNLQLVSISASTVDWPRTEQYTYAVRAKHYAETQGDEDFARLGNRITEALNDINLTEDPARRLEMAQEARDNLATFPLENYGYRSEEIGTLVEMLDEVVARMRLAAGQRVELGLTAMTMPPPPVPLLPVPDLRGNLEQAFSAAGHSPDPGERVSLLRAITAALKGSSRTDVWASRLGRRVSSALAAELRIDRSYKDLVSRTMAGAAARARRGDVGGVEALVGNVLEADDRLGHKRPHEMASLLTYLDAQLEEARRLRLARDAWALRRQLFDAYRRDIAPAGARLRLAKPWLDEIRRLAGPQPNHLGRYEQRVVMARQALEQVPPPAELDAAHSLYTAAFQMARRAAATRRNAVSSNDMKLAWDASSAAAGALTLLERADAELGRLAAVPGGRPE